MRAVLDLAGALARAGDDVVVATFDATDVPDAWRAGGTGLPRVATLPTPALPGAWFARSQRGALREAVAGADVVHVHAMWTPSNAQVAAVARSMEIPYVLTPHGMLDDWSMAQRRAKKVLYLALAGRKMLRHAAAVHCTASAEAQQAGRWFNNRTEVAPVLFDLGPYRTLPGAGASERAFPMLERGAPVALFLSRLHEKKRPQALIEAASVLRDRGVDVTVAIAGSGEPALEASLRGLVERFGLADRVFLLGMVRGEEKVSLLERADVFVLPTSQENFGIALVEAMACATPVVTTKGVDIWPELAESGGATIIERADGAAVAGAIEGLLRDGARLRAMGDAARAWALRELDERAVVGRYREMYARAVRPGV